MRTRNLKHLHPNSPHTEAQVALLHPKVEFLSFPPQILLCSNTVMEPCWCRCRVLRS